MAKRSVTDDQAHCLAELYVWSAVRELMESSTAPRRLGGQSAATRVIAICKMQQQKLIAAYDTTEQEPSHG